MSEELLLQKAIKQLELKISENKEAQQASRTEQARLEAKAGKSGNILRYVCGGLIGAASVGVTAFFTYLTDDRKIDLELAKLSLTILSGEYEQDDAKYLPARRFALNALEKGTGVKISDEDKTSWAKSGVTPVLDLERLNSSIFKFARDRLVADYIGRVDQALHSHSINDQGLAPQICVDIKSPIGRHCGTYSFVDEVTGEICVAMIDFSRLEGQSLYDVDKPVVICGSNFQYNRESLPW